MRLAGFYSFLSIFLFSNELVANSNAGILKHRLVSAQSSEQIVQFASELSSHYYKTSCDSSLYYIKIAISHSNKQEIGCKMELLEKGSSIAKVKARYNEGVGFALAGLKLAESIGDTIKMIDFYKSLGGLYHYMEEYDKALYCFDKEAALLKIYPNNQKEINLASNFGHIYRLTGQPEKALMFYLKSIKQNKGTIGNCSTYGDIGKAYMEMDSCHKALGFIQAEIQCIKERNGGEIKTNGYSSALINMSDVSICIGEYRQGIGYAKTGLFLAEQFGNLLHQLEQLANLHNANAQLGDYKEAYHFQLKHAQMKDSIMNLQVTAQIAESEVRYEVDKHQDELKKAKQQLVIEELNRDRIEERRLFIFCTALLTLLLVILLIQFRAYKMKQQNYELEQKLLRSQMNPHFIFNALMAAKKFLYRSDLITMDKYLYRIANLVRYTLESTRFEYIRLDKEIENWKHYVEVQRLRILQALDFKIEIKELPDYQQLLIPPMLVQPLVENALEHAIQHLPEGDTGKLFIGVMGNYQQLVITVRDNGRHNSVHSGKDNHISMATNIINERLMSYNSRYSRKSYIELNKKTQEEGGGTEVIMYLSCIKVKETQYIPAFPG